jgi:transcriptional regulator with PAS, ATPase and Fis domain
MSHRPPDPGLKSTPADEPSSDFHWTAFFQRSTQPLFVLNRRRQLLFANRAWEALTGLSARDVRKQVCKRQRDAAPGSMEAVLSAISPPREALEGRPARARRMVVAQEKLPRWWDIEFNPILGPQGVLGLVGKIQASPPNIELPGRPLPEKLTALRQRLDDWRHLQHLPVQTPTMRRVAGQARLASSTNVPVLLIGEAGAGKAWLARAIHQESPRRDFPFFDLDCGHLPPAALASALFGPVGFASRTGATIYLRQPSCLPREMQARLCEVFATAAPDLQLPRLIAGSTCDSAVEMQAGRFLEEFHCLLGTLTIHIPPLRERNADLPILLDMFLRRASAGRDKPITKVSDDAMEALRGYSWPGNLRELYTIIATACARAKSDCIQAADLAWFLSSPAPAPQRALPLDNILEQAERRLILWAVTKAKGNKSKAAEMLQISRQRLLRRMETLGIEG